MKKSLKFRKNKTGFTLVELVIVIAIVIILSVISVPIYRGYVDKAKLSEGYALLGTILSAQKAYYSQYGNFLKWAQSSAGSNKWTANEEVLGIDGRGNKYFTWFSVSGGGDNRYKYYFDTAVQKPTDFQDGDNTMLLLQYNITKGARVVDYMVEGFNYGVWQ